MVVLLRNKQASFNYEILDKYSAGIKLLGIEVKALKTAKGGSLVGSFIVSKGDRLWLKGMHIPPYQPGNTEESYDPNRLRELLLKKSELVQVQNKLQSKGLTAIPIAVHNTGRITLEFALAKGKKKHDKRQTLRKREDERRVAREHKVR